MGEGSEAVVALMSCGVSVGHHEGGQRNERQKICLVAAACVRCNPSHPGTFLPMRKARALHLPRTRATAVPLPPGLLYCSPALLSFPVLLSTVPSVVHVVQVALGSSQPSLSSTAVVSSWIPPCSARTDAQVTGMLPTALSYSLTAPHSQFLHPCLHRDLFPLKETRLEGCSPTGPGALTAPGTLTVESDVRLPVISFPALKHSADEGLLPVVFIREKSLSLSSTKEVGA